MPNFIEIGSVAWISIADTHGTHIDFYILDRSWAGNIVSTFTSLKAHSHVSLILH
jgi:hypothetical protein